MLYGIRRRAQADLARAGYTVRVYVPYGTRWYPYFMRRLAERPANLLFLLRNLIRQWPIEVSADRSMLGRYGVDALIVMTIGGTDGRRPAPG